MNNATISLQVNVPNLGEYVRVECEYSIDDGDIQIHTLTVEEDPNEVYSEGDEFEAISEDEIANEFSDKLFEHWHSVHEAGRADSFMDAQRDGRF